MNQESLGKTYAWARVPQEKLQRSDVLGFFLNHWCQSTQTEGPNGLSDVRMVYCEVVQTLTGPEYRPVPMWDLPVATLPR